MSKVSDELLPCPFCGGPGMFEGEEGAGYEVVCQHCGARSGWGDYGYQAEASWNRRSASAPAKAVRVTDEMVEAAARAICWSPIQGYSWRLHSQEEKHRYVDRNWNQYANAARAALSALEDEPQQDEGARND